MSFEREMADRVAAETAAREQEEKNVEAQKKRDLWEEFERLENLLKNPDVKWLLDQFQFRVDQERDKALSISLPALEAEYARHRHAIAKELCEMLPKRRQDLYNRIHEEKVLTSAV